MTLYNTTSCRKSGHLITKSHHLLGQEASKVCAQLPVGAANNEWGTDGMLRRTAIDGRAITNSSWIAITFPTAATAVKRFVTGRAESSGNRFVSWSIDAIIDDITDDVTADAAVYSLIIATSELSMISVKSISRKIELYSEIA